MESTTAWVDAPAIQLDVERLDVYAVAREFDALAARLLPRRGQAALRDQLARASSSIMLNIAEGAGRFAGADKAHFYLIARGSTMECAAVLDVMLGRGLLTDASYRHARGLLVRVLQMLTRLAQRMQSR